MIGSIDFIGRINMD